MNPIAPSDQETGFQAGSPMVPRLRGWSNPPSDYNARSARLTCAIGSQGLRIQREIRLAANAGYLVDTLSPTPNKNLF